MRATAHPKPPRAKHVRYPEGPQSNNFCKNEKAGGSAYKPTNDRYRRAAYWHYEIVVSLNIKRRHLSPR